MVIGDEQLMKWPSPEYDVKTMLAEYYRYVSLLDVQVGRVLDAVDASPYATDTLIVFAADSGVARGSHGLIDKQNLYEHSMRVPLIVAGTGIAADKRSEAMCSLFDLMPTLGKLCGVATTQGSNGREFTSVLKEPAQPGRPFLMFGYKTIRKVLSDGRWKLIRYPHVDRTQLFDLQSDPFETRDLSADPAQAERIKAMLAKLATEMKADGDNDLLTAVKLQFADCKAPTKLPKPGHKGH